MSMRAHAPVLAQPLTPRMPPVVTHTLASGLDCHIVEQRELPVVEMRLIVRGGASCDTPDVAGRSYLLAELLDQGTATRSATEIADQAELLGASLQTRATWDTLTIALHVLTPRIVPALDLLSDVALRPAFAAPELERKRQERLAAILQESDEPRVLASQAFHRHAFDAAHPFSAPLGGTQASVSGLERSGIVDLYAKSFTPDNSFLVIVGDLDVDHAIDLAARSFGDWRPARAPVRTADVATAQADSAVHIIDRPGAPQSELRVGMAGPPRHTSDYFPLLVGNTVLGGAFTSRLNMRLREEKAYTYGAGSSFALRRAGGPFLAATAVATAATADAIDVIVHEITRMTREAVPEQELERARQYLVLGLARTFETTGDVAEHVAELALHGLGFDWYDHFSSAVRGVTAADVQGASARWLDPDRLIVGVAGDASLVSAEIESLNVGAVHVHESS